MSVAERIRSKLESELSPSRLEIIDESSQHAGHASAPAGGESHFRLTITAGAFEKLGRIDRQRLVHQILAEEEPFYYLPCGFGCYLVEAQSAKMKLYLTWQLQAIKSVMSVCILKKLHVAPSGYL